MEFLLGIFVIRLLISLFEKTLMKNEIENESRISVKHPAEYELR